MGAIKVWLVALIREAVRAEIAELRNANAFLPQVESVNESFRRSTKKPLTGAQMRRLNEQENARFLEDRGEPTNSEILKEQAKWLKR